MKVVIVGMGIAGLTSAIMSDERGDETTLVVKSNDPFLSASAWAQGGIVYKGEDDSPEQLMADMQHVSGGMTRHETLELLTREGPRFVEDFFIKKIGVPFAMTRANDTNNAENTNDTNDTNDTNNANNAENTNDTNNAKDSSHPSKAHATYSMTPTAIRDSENKRDRTGENNPKSRREMETGTNDHRHDKTEKGYLLTKEAGHQCERILFSGDKTGEVIVNMLYQYLIEHTKVTVLWNHVALDLINIPHHSVDPMSVYEQTHCVGLYVLEKKTHCVKKLFADKIILATGGIGQIYKQTTNPPTATGDGIAIAYRAGVRVINMEFTQFHPTSLAMKKANGFLVSEALRGEGAVLVNEKGVEFATESDVRGSLTPRDKLSRMIIAEQRRTHEDHVYVSFKDCDFDLKTRFPKIYEKCKHLGLNLEQQRIPVTPAFHFSCGGILVDTNGQTSVSNLYAVGECACTGVHGANRLASTSLLEASYFAYRAVLHKPSILHAIDEDTISDWRFAKNPATIDPVLLYQDFMTVRSLMWNYVGVVRKNHTLSRALQELSFLKERVDEYYRTSIPTQNIVELRNVVQTAILVTEAAIKNTHSIGSHYLEGG